MTAQIKPAKKQARLLFLFMAFLMIQLIGLSASVHAQIDPGEEVPSENTRIEALDLFLFSQNWGTAEQTTVDFNQDGVVDRKDLLFFIDFFHDTVGEIPTPTPTLPGGPTPTPTLPDVPTATPTPTLPDAPTATPTPTLPDAPTATPTPTLTPSPTPTPLPLGILFYSDFDVHETLEGEGFHVLETEEEQALLLEQGRLPSGNFLSPWKIYSSTGDEVPELGVALTEPGSASLNSESGFYQSLQTSVMEIAKTLDTTESALPVLTFEAAFITDLPFFKVGDYMAVEISSGTEARWTFVDINNDGEIITDPTQFNFNSNEPLQVGTFDALYGLSNPQNEFGPLTKEDFIKVQIELPIDPELRIAFRFESDTSLTEEGIYLDNVMVHDLGGGNIGAPIIRSVKPLDDIKIYADIENRVLVAGSNLSPVTKVLYSSRDGEAVLDFITNEDESIIITLPRLADPSSSETASLRVIREDGEESTIFGVVISVAPMPVISAVSPDPFLLGTSNTIMRIVGNNFRSGADGSIVTIDAGDGNPVIFQNEDDFTIREKNLLEFDASQLAAFSAGTFMDVIVHNQYTGLDSNTSILMLQDGSGEIVVHQFQIDLGFSSHTIVPPTDIYPLQTDQTFTLIWDADNLQSNSTNIDINGEPLVVNGQSIAENGLVDVFINSFGATIELAPNVLNVTGDITTSIRVANGDPVIKIFTLNDPLPPVLYQRDDDWRNRTLSANESYPGTGLNDAIPIYGDNFRGLRSSRVDPEPVTSVHLLEVVDGTLNGVVIDMPPIQDSFDYQIQPIIADTADGEDVLYQSIPAGLIPMDEGNQPRTFILRVMNASGLFTDSMDMITFVP